MLYTARAMASKSASSEVLRAPFPDFLRIILCFGVCFYHFTPERPACGSYMVLGFLVMSGFLLGVHFERISALDALRFYSSKVKRLLPLFVVALAIGVGVRWALCIVNPGTSGMLPAYSSEGWGNFNPAIFVAYYNAPLWYMVIEFFMLLCAPFLFWAYKGRLALYVVLALSVLTACFLYSQVPYSSDHGSGLYYSPIARLWQFVAGLCAAKIMSRCSGGEHPIRRRVANTACVLLAGLFLAGAWWTMSVKQAAELHFWNYTFDFDCIVVLLYAVLVPLLYSRTWKMGGKPSSVLAWLALLTYPVYLLHVPFYIAITGVWKRIFTDVDFICVGLVVAVTMVAGALLLQLQKKLID